MNLAYFLQFLVQIGVRKLRGIGLPVIRLKFALTMIHSYSSQYKFNNNALVPDNPTSSTTSLSALSVYVPLCI